MNLVRPGLLAYGLHPSGEKPGVEVEPIMSWKTRIVRVRRVPKGTSISYARAFVTARRRVVISLAKQQLTYYYGDAPIATHPVSTGRPGMPTPTGTYAVLDKKPRAWSSAAKLWMPYWMPFIGTKYGMHELPEWPGGFKEGQDHLGTPVSHGCIRLGVGAAKEVYDWVEVGTDIEIVKS